VGVNIKYIAAAAFGLILLAIGGLFFYAQSTKAPSQENATVAETKVETAKNNLLALISSGSTQECTFQYEDDDNGSMKGIFYLSGDKFRGDIDVTNEDDDTSTVSIIRNGNTNYIWGSEMETGIKMTLPVDEFSKSDQAKGYLDAEKEVDYKCKSWLADPTKFNPPSNLKFLDLSSINVTQPKSTDGDSEDQCSACNSLSGDAKTTCLTQLNCQ